MRQRSNLIILFGIAFFIVGGAIAYLVIDDDDGDGDAASDGRASVTVMVAAADIPANTLGSEAIEQGLLDTEQVPAGTEPAGYQASASGLDNQIFAVNVSEGDIITTAQLATRSLSNIQVPEGYDGVAVTVDYTPGGAGYVAPGDTVNIYGVYGPVGSFDGEDAGLSASEGGAPGPTPRTELALTNVLVLGVSEQQPTAAQTSANSETNDASSRLETNRPLTYFLALTPADAERVVQLTSFANLYLSLTAEDAPNAGETGGVSGGNVNGPVGTASAAPQS